jgi:hypothetical protein
VPSQLKNLDRKLIWKDFPKKQAAAPKPGQSATAAQTWSGYSMTNPHFEEIPQSSPKRFRLVNDLTVTVTFTSSKSHVKSWVFSRPQTEQDDLLNHEQGHYSITALLARDYFVEMMLIKSTEFASAADGTAEANRLKAATLGKLKAVQDLYDAEVHPEQNQGKSRGPIQVGWDTLIRNAFTRPRSSGTTAPDGTPHKMRLTVALSNAGKQV